MQVSPNFINHLVNEVVAKGGMTLEDAQTNISFDVYLRQGVSSNLSTGVVVSAILAYFLQTKKNSLKEKTAVKPMKKKYQGKNKIK